MVKDIRRRTRKHHSAQKKIRIVMEGPHGEDGIAGLCRREGIPTSLLYSWSNAMRLEAVRVRNSVDLAAGPVLVLSDRGQPSMSVKRSTNMMPQGHYAEERVGSPNLQ